MIYHITQRKAWGLAQSAGAYRGDTLDTQGFIHCSTSRQVVPVANSYYPGQHGLVLLCIDPGKLRSQLRYEAPDGPAVEGDNCFPHIYGPLNTDAVAGVLSFEPGPDGLFTMPDNVSLEEQLGRIFSAKKLTLATAESCTGGLLASSITDLAGSSDYFLGGVVSYAYSAKETLLGIDHGLLMAEGAVNETVARQMAHGVREKLGADVALSITGIAGPAGGTPEKPVGLVWIGLSDAQGDRAEQYQWTSDRIGNKRLSVEKALQMLIDWGKAASPRSQ